MRARAGLVYRLVCGSVALSFGCGPGSAGAESVRPRAGVETRDSCNAHFPASTPLPGVKQEEQTLEYWLARFTKSELETVLMDEASITAYNQRIGRRQGRETYSQRDLRVPVDSLGLNEELRERLAFLRADLTANSLVTRDGQVLSEPLKQRFEQPVKMALQSAEPRVVLETSLLRCGPYDGGLYKPEVQLAYDRNACGPLLAQEPVEVLGTAGDMLLVRSRYSLGFLPAQAALSAPIPAPYLSAFLRPERLVAPAETSLKAASGGDEVRLRARTALAQLPSGEPIYATAKGIRRLAPNPALRPQLRPLTRHALLSEAFATLGKRYGLGGAEGGIDCSGLTLELLESFDLALTRYSGWQAESGSHSVDVRNLPAEEKLRHLDVAAKSGVVLLYLPGHIMLYLGRNAAGAPRALHALGEYVEPCGETGEKTIDVQRVVVSGLELGQRTSRGSLLERITRLVVFGAQPDPAQGAVSDAGPAAPAAALQKGEACDDSSAHRIFVSPAAPVPGDSLRVIAASQTDPSGASLRLFDADGHAVPIDELGLGGPPFGRIVRAPKVRAGVYTAVLGRGPKHYACRRVQVRAQNAAASRVNGAEGDPYWEPKNAWQRDTEALYALFVEQLFAGAADDEQTWTNLHSLLRDPARNLLWNYLGRNEDDKLEIEPDCADLPYSLRAYFAWKLRLPYGYRQCSRGRTDKPPMCGEIHTPLAPRKANDDVAAFAEFVNRGVRWGVHSGTGRTHPDDSQSDLYPVALERSTLIPGTVYADPYGHVMMISKWFAQGSLPGSPYGVLMAAEAQPDGTIGRRRFWQGSFLFDPNTNSYGAGFKRFRPLSYDRATESLTTTDNQALMRQREFPRFSREQYEGSREGFYDRMEVLINPRPLPPQAHLQSLVAALDEAARRRVLSVDNGEDYAKSHRGQTISMPRGYEIFETEGAWEDFATPSRDMRLLIAIDTVRALPGRIERSPERFLLPEGSSANGAADAIRAAMDRELHARSFVYTRSDGSPQTLTLADVVARADAFEVAYNPNDCAEVRWGAPEGAPERSTCSRTAPDQQHKNMQTYRAWFRTRTRPPRGS